MVVKKRAEFGSTRRTSSGKVQARYVDASGQRHTLGTFPNEKAARAALAAVQTDIARGDWTDESKGQLLFSELAEQVLAVRAQELAPRTIENYESLLKRWLLPTFGTKRVNTITVLMVDSWWATMGSKTGAVNRRNAYFVLSGIMRYAVRYSFLKSSPCIVENAGKEVSKPRPYLSPSNFERILSATPERLHAPLWLAFGAHLRLGELTGLDRRHIDLKAGTITIEQQAQQARGGLQIRETKTGTAETIKLPARARAREEIAAYLGANPKLPNSPLFTGERGGRLSRGYIYKHWVRAAAEMGLSDAHFHDARHTGLTVAAQAGATTRELMRRARHTTQAASIRYQHATDQRDNEVAERMSALMEKGA